MIQTIFWVLVLGLVPCVSVIHSSLPSSCNLRIKRCIEEYQYEQDGDIIIGGVVTVNYDITQMKAKYIIDEDMLCLCPFPMYYKKLLSFLFAIEEVNKDYHILPNVTLGYHIYDSCGSPKKAMKSVMQILSGEKTPVPNYACTGYGNLAGVVGDLSTDTTLPLAQMLGVYRYTQIPQSQCSENCLPGYRKAPIRGQPTCCYDCVPCADGEISITTDSENCQTCSDYNWPNEKKDRCVPKVTEFLSYTDDIMVILFSIVAISFAILTVIILGIFIYFLDTPIVKANNQNLSFLLLVSIILSYLCVFLFIGRPVDITCQLRQISFGIIFSTAVSSLLAKTIMVGIAFKATKPGSNWRKWVGFQLSNSVVIIFSSIQIIICVSWLGISPPYQELNMHSDPGKIIVQCNEGSAFAFYSVLGYMGLLAAVSFVIAFYTRTLPDSFNEAKFITFSMLVFCSVWIAMIPAYLSTKGKKIVAVEVFAILASNTGLLGCIFFPKCYIILFRSEMNTKINLLGKIQK
ncbi:vomeronasal type-2 receptor 26-like [Discoglossus pictus]